MSYAGYKMQYHLSALRLTEKAAVRTALQIGIRVNKGDPFQKTLKRALRHLYLGRMTETDLAASMACLQSCAKHFVCTNGLSACSRETEARATASNEMLQALQKMRHWYLMKHSPESFLMLGGRTYGLWRLLFEIPMSDGC